MTTNTHSLRLAPGAVVGILGGGQLGRMLSMAAHTLGLRSHIFCPEPDCPAAQVSNRSTYADYTDQAALTAFAAEVDVVTYEFENVPVETVAILQKAGAIVRPGAKALETAQDRLVEKEFLRSLGIDTAPFHAVDCVSDLDAGLSKIGRPAILKTRRLGYDGKGQTRITDNDIDLHASFEKAVAFAWEEVGAAPSILEGFVPFEREASIIGARRHDGAVALFEPIENVHRDGILKQSTVPAAVSRQTAQGLAETTKQILDALDYVGVIGVEFFIMPDGSFVANEMAPRVHNSGHLTQDACTTSQFEQQIRAVAGWPLGAVDRHSNVIMENLIGDEAHAWESIVSEPNASLYLYGKNEARPGRKMGHVNRRQA